MKTSHLLFIATSGVLLPLTSASQSFDIEIPGDVDFYGKAELALTYADSGVLKRVDKGTHLNSIFSRVGIKGSVPLSEQYDDIELIYTLEVEVNGFDDEAKDQPFSARNTFMGFSSATYGSVVFGRNDTRFKNSEGCMDLFKEREGNIKQLFAGQDRIGDTATYISPSIKGFKLGATWVLGDDSAAQNGKNGYSFSATYGDSKLKKQLFYLAAAVNQKVLGIDAWRILGQVDLGQVQLGGLFQYTEKDSANLSGEGFIVNMAVPFANNIAKLQYSYDNAKIIHPEKAHMVSLGVDHHVSKSTTIYLAATYLDLETQDDSAVSLALRHFF